MSVFTKRFVCLLLYKQTYFSHCRIPVFVNLNIWWQRKSNTINNFATDQMIVTIGLSSWRVAVKELSPSDSLRALQKLKERRDEARRIEDSEREDRMKERME